MGVLAAILHIGNLKFGKDEKIEDAVKIDNIPGLFFASVLYFVARIPNAELIPFSFLSHGTGV